MLKPKIKGLIYFTISLLIVIYVNFFTDLLTFEPVYGIYMDSTKLYFLHKLYDPALFRNDLLTSGFLNLFDISKGVVFTYSVLSHIFLLPIAMKVVSVTLCLSTIIIIYRIGVYLYSRDFAFIFAGLFTLYFLSLDSFYGGQGRTFGIFIFSIFLLIFIKENFLFLPFFVPLAIYLYLPVSLLLATICILIILFFNKKLSLLNIRRLYIFILIFAVAASIIIVLNSFIFESFFKNPQILLDNKLFDYKYTQKVISPIAIYNPAHVLLYFVLNLNEHSDLYIYLTTFLLALCMTIVFFKKKEAFSLPRQIWIMLLASALSFIIVYPFFPTLASRQFVFSMPLFIVFFISTAVFKATNYKVFYDSVIIFSTAVFIVLNPILNGLTSLKGYKPLYDYIETLPKNALISGNPKSTIIRTIPFYTKRSIFFTDKLRDIYFFIYGDKETLKRRQHLIEALYADSLEKVKNIIYEYNIGYFVIESDSYSKPFIDYLKYSPTPYDSTVYNVIQDRKYNNNFILLQFAKKHFDFKVKENDGEIFILSSEKIKQSK